MALTLDPIDVMERFAAPDDAKVFVLDCMSRLAPMVVDSHAKTQLRMAFDILSGVEMQVWE